MSLGCGSAGVVGYRVLTTLLQGCAYFRGDSEQSGERGFRSNQNSNEWPVSHSGSNSDDWERRRQRW
jgi:hypothetical protein